MDDIDLDAYFTRIGYRGSPRPTLETLRALHRLHPAAIPFEAIDVLLGRNISLAPDAIDAKLIFAGRGGYCFEHNNLFKRVLIALGFDVAALIALPRWNRAFDEPARPRTHMALRARLEGVDWLADVGFGVCMLTAPVRFDLATPQETCFEPVRLTPVNGEFRFEVLIAGVWAPVCVIDPRPLHDVDFIAPNWFTSTHPESQFRRDLIVTRTMPRARYTLLDNRLTVRRPGAEVERRRLAVEELEQSLAQDFGLPVAPEWRPTLERAVAAGSRVTT